MGILSSIFGGSKTSTTNFNSQTDPWDEAIPQLKDFLGRIQGFQSQGFQISPEQQAVFDKLVAALQGGNPQAGAIEELASSLLSTGSRGGAIDEALKQYQSQLADVAAGKNVEGFQDNPYIGKMLQQVGSDISNRINQQFAAAGRDLSGINQQVLAEGVSRGTLPLLLEQYNRELGRTDAARAGLLSGTLSGVAGANAADQYSNLARIAGIDVSKEGVDAKTSGLNAVLNLLQQQRELPIANAGQFLEMLGSVAGLGQQSSGVQTTKTTSTPGLVPALLSAGTALFGTGPGNPGLVGGLGYSISDRRAKEGVEEIGALADGTPIYRFSYKGDPSGTVQVGLMAQDIRKSSPDAVIEGEDGMMRVEYGRATDRAAGLLRGVV